MKVGLLELRIENTLWEREGFMGEESWKVKIEMGRGRPFQGRGTVEYFLNTTVYLGPPS